MYNIMSSQNVSFCRKSRVVRRIKEHSAYLVFICIINPIDGNFSLIYISTIRVFWRVFFGHKKILKGDCKHTTNNLFKLRKRTALARFYGTADVFSQSD